MQLFSLVSMVLSSCATRKPAGTMNAMSCCSRGEHADLVLMHQIAHPVGLVAVEEVLCAHRARGQVPALVVRKLRQVHAAVALHAVARIQAEPGAAAAQVAVWAMVDLHETPRLSTGRCRNMLWTNQLHYSCMAGGITQAQSQLQVWD